MNGIDPVDLFRRLGRFDVEVDGGGFLAAADEDAAQHLGRAGVDLLMRHERRDVDEIAWPRLGGKLQMLAPPHARPAADHVDHALQLSMVVSAGLRVGLHGDRTGPELAGPGSGVRDRRRARHARGLRRVEIELRTRNDLDSVIAPVGCGLYGLSWGSCPADSYRVLRPRQGRSKASQMLDRLPAYAHASLFCGCLPFPIVHTGCGRSDTRLPKR